MKRKIFIIVILGVILSTSMCLKAHKIQECKVIQENDKWVTVIHPNGEVYDFFNDNENSYKKDDLIKVSFNELKLSKKNYTINSVK
jgi:hypothetical protein